MSQPANEDLPEFLRSPESFSEHLRDQFEDEDNQGKGDAFVEFACRLLPMCDFWSGFPDPTVSEKKTHDKGVDFVSKNSDASVWICGQSKFRIRETKELDEVISKFSSYENALEEKYKQQADPQQSLLSEDGSTKKAKPARKKKEATELVPATMPSLRFVLVTSSKLGTIRKNYEEQAFSSKKYYELLSSTGRLEIIDGPKLLTILQSLYRKSYLVAPEITLDLDVPHIKSDKVYISILTGKALSDLYEVHGSSIFFENIREYLGPSSGSEGRESVNSDILETLNSEPERMLGRNNGVTFKAETVTILTDNKLQLTKASIVNGCQTTMSVVDSGQAGYTARILVKIVESQDSWDVAKSANYQNSIPRIDLDLARLLRPQLVRKAATDIGYSMEPSGEHATVSMMLEAVHNTKVSYDALRALYIGIFSRYPNNLFALNYSEIRIDILKNFQQKTKHEYLMKVLFKLLQAMKRAMGKAKDKFKDPSYTDVFNRFLNEKKVQYQCILAILTACGCINDPLVKSGDETEAYNALLSFIERLDIVLDKYPDHFDKAFRHAFTVMASAVLRESIDGSTLELTKKLYNDIQSLSGANFNKIFAAVRLNIDNDDFFDEHPLTFE